MANNVERIRVGFGGKSSPKADGGGWFCKESLGKYSLCVSVEILKCSFLSLSSFFGLSIF